jgi:hypothetical protein
MTSICKNVQSIVFLQKTESCPLRICYACLTIYQATFLPRFILLKVQVTYLIRSSNIYIVLGSILTKQFHLYYYHYYQNKLARLHSSFTY